jgi:hypothetical protein
MALLIQLGITDVSLLRGYPKITHPKCMVVCIHLYAHTARLVLATVDSVEELPVVLHQTGIIIGQEYQGVSDRPQRLVRTALHRNMLWIWELCGVVDSVSLPDIKLMTT